MTLYKIKIENRDYQCWNIVNATTGEPCSTVCDPITNKLFDQDIFIIQKEAAVITYSQIRSTDSIPGVLILTNNKTYGKFKDKFLYKCIPDDIHIPHFLVPYEMKKMGFSKVFQNLYVTFKFTEWTTKHPQGSLQQVIGPVDVLVNFYEYQLYCKHIHVSIQKFHKETMNAIRRLGDAENIIDKISADYNSSNRVNHYDVFSIDPENSVDFDDAFSLQTLDKKTVLSIYISNVPLLLDHLDLWDVFSKRISTIYLPDKKRSMLPSILSDSLCSLQENQNRVAFVLDITFEDGEIADTKLSNCVICVKKNYVYEEPALKKSNNYKLLLDLSRNYCKKVNYLTEIKDSHDVVSFWMIFMNHYCAKELYNSRCGIFRSTCVNNQAQDRTKNIPEHIRLLWNNVSGQYIEWNKFNSENEQTSNKISLRHEGLNIDLYAHITSPIRRIVDLLNMIQIQENHSCFSYSAKAKQFYNHWSNEMDYINTTTKMIKRVQNECNLLELCEINNDLMDKNYQGYCLDAKVRDTKTYEYTIYLPELKLYSRVFTCETLTLYEKYKFCMFVFHNEEKFKKKIRLQLN